MKTTTRTYLECSISIIQRNSRTARFSDAILKVARSHLGRLARPSSDPTVAIAMPRVVAVPVQMPCVQRERAIPTT